MSDSLVKRWNSIFVSYNEELTTIFASSETNEYAIYTEYRDELDDFVTVKD